jgi:DNA-binding MarR family transcriptional regulator
VGNKVDASETRELARQLAGLFRYLTLAGGGDFLREVSELDLSLTQLKALSLLDERPAALSLKDVSEQLGLSVPTTSRAVDGLVRRRLVDRDEDALDRRVRRVGLTAAGRRVVENLTAIRMAGLNRLVESFSNEERKKLAAALEAIPKREEIRRLCPRGSAAR